MKQDFFCSWSGGKDSCLALYRAINKGGVARLLLTMFNEDDERTRSHGIGRDVLEAQVAALGIPGRTAATSWQTYEKVFTDVLLELKEAGVDYGVFGDIDLEAHREWCVRICASAGLQAIHPLWQERRIDLIHEFIDLGFKAIVVAVKADTLDTTFLGRPFDRELIKQLQELGVDPCGESGEFHTLVVDGPIFKHPLEIVVGKNICHDGYCFLDVALQKPIVK